MRSSFVRAADRFGAAAETISNYLRRYFRGEIKQFLQRLIEAIELVFAQLIGRFEPQLLAHQRERTQRMPKLRTTVLGDLVQHSIPDLALAADHKVGIVVV